MWVCILVFARLQQARRLPELHHDLAMVVNRMNISEADRQSVRARLAVTDVLSVAAAQGKRFAMMNGVCVFRTYVDALCVCRYICIDTCIPWHTAIDVP